MVDRVIGAVTRIANPWACEDLIEVLCSLDWN